MQKLRERNTYTPTDIPHVRSNCDSRLKSPEGRGRAASSKTSPNNLDAALTARDTHPMGVDSGYSHVGLSAVSENKELYGEEIHLRDDIVKLNAERKQYRRGRRYRKTWYRKPRFLNRGNKKEGWLAPSLQNKLNAHLKTIEKVRKILPISQTTVEVAAFDIQKIQNTAMTTIRGKLVDQIHHAGIPVASTYGYITKHSRKDLDLSKSFGRRATGYFDLRSLNGTKIHASANAADLSLLESARTFLTERRKAHSSDSLVLSEECANFL